MSNPCIIPDPCIPCNPTYTDLGCINFVNSECIIYNGDDIPCLSIVKTENLNEILQHLKDIICALEPTAYEDFDYGCFSTEGIETEQQFVEFISSVLCEVLGTQEVGSLTSLSALNSLILALTTQVNLIKNQTVLSCFQTISGLSSSENISDLLSAIQTIVCDHEDRIVALEASSGVALVATDSATIDFTTSGTAGHALTGSVKLSAVANNALTAQVDGIHVLSPAVTVVDTNSINFTASGIHSHTITGECKISATSGNVLTIQSDGLLAKPSPIDAQDSTTINFTYISDISFTGSVIIDPNVNNILVATGAGLFVDGNGFTLGDNSVTNAILRDSGPYSVIGKATLGTGDPADITAGADEVLRRSGTGNLGFGSLVTNNIGDDQVTFAKTQNIQTGKLVGRSTGGTGDMEQITVSTGLTLAAGVLTSDWTLEIEEGTYTPTLTNGTNVAASTAYVTNYQRISNTVKVWGDVSINTTAAATISQLSMELPIVSAIGNTYDLAGTAAFEDNTVVQIKGDSTSDVALFRFTPVTDTNNKYSFHFIYTILTP